MAQSPVITEKTEELYVGRSVAEEVPPRDLAVTFAMLVQFLSSPEAALTAEQFRSVHQDARLAADYTALKRKLCIAELPQASAASHGDLEERIFPGGRLQLCPSVLPGQIYLIVSIENTAPSPRMLLVEGKNGEVARIALPAPDPDGSMLVIQDTANNEGDALAVRLLRDPSSSGVFLP